MRFIDNRHIQVPDGWEQAGQQALSDVTNGVCDVDARSHVWRDLKIKLAELSHDKCWYCEAKQERSDDAVDHYRPKGRVAEALRAHDGYWWLAFEKNNYRYSCTFCNSRRKNPATGQAQGKGDRFPLIDESQRGYNPGEETNEESTLLDPCKAMEPGWLDFRGDGRPCAKYPDDPLKKEKAERSIELYHLDHEDQNEARRNIAADLESWIDEANGLIGECGAGRHAVNGAFSGIVRNIINAMNAKSRYSAFARRLVAARRDLEWVEELFQTA